MWGKMLLPIHVETFFWKNGAQIEVTWRNKGVSRNLHIFLPAIVLTLGLCILDPHTLSPNLPRKVQQICKIVAYFEVTTS